MKTSMPIVALLGCLMLSACESSGGSPGPATASAGGQNDTTVPPTSELAGDWSGSGTIVVDWVSQKTLPVQLRIAADGTVTGKVGDATLASATIRHSRGSFQRSMGWGRDFRIHGNLQGDLIAAEKVQRDGVDIVFDRAPDGTLVGGLATTGMEIGPRDRMKISVGRMVLRQGNAPASQPSVSTR